MTNLEWIRKGNTGCTFATFFSKIPEKIGWEFYDYNTWKVRNLFQIETANIISICFPKDFTKEDVRKWALSLNFYVENTSDNTEGLRIKVPQGEAWVQYFGPDSHVKTRRSPEPMLLYCNKTGVSYYWKVGFNGVLHLAHAWLEGAFTKKKAYTMWDRAHKQTKKIIGHNLTIAEAAKTTWKRDI
jgi:hypothetical protein